MPQSLTLEGSSWPRWLSFAIGLGMMAASIMTMQHFFSANYPTSIWEGSFCDISAFFNCDSSAFSVISQIAGVPIGFFGLMAGGLVSLGALYPSAGFERTNKSIALMNILGVIVLFAYSVIGLGTLCLLCTGYYLFSAVSFFLFWKYGIDQQNPGIFSKYFNPSLKLLVTFGVITLMGAYGIAQFHEARKVAQAGGVIPKIVEQFFELPTVPSPSIISPFWAVKSTEAFEDAPIQIIEYSDFRCPDCLYQYGQFRRLEAEFKGQINVVFQFFPLEGICNDVVEKDLHPGACELSYIAAYDPEKFLAIHDDIFENFRDGRNLEWRAELARKYGVEAALTDQATRELVQRIIQTGAEYEKTSDRYTHGIRSTPTMIINNRLVIGTFPDDQMRAIFQALVEEHESGGQNRFMENWVERGR